ncbi:MAG TPA: hypothetical protein VM553_07190, partial [Dongiaceae bacterium]|nr:hypothetical protein [Dongiaceae bacterium]
MSPRSRSFRSLLSLQTLFAALLILLHCPAFAKSLTAPAQADADSPVKIGFQGADNEREFITILKPDEPEGRYGDYEYTKGDSIELFAPVEPGDYEIRWLGAETPYPTIERQPLKVLPIAAKLQAPASAAIVTDIKVQWEGPNHPRDFITIVSATTPERQYAEYEYTDKGNPLTLQAPTTPGAYEIRYLTGRGYATIGKTAITITDSSASVEFTSPARIGGVLPVKWTGPANEREYITVVKATEPDGRYANYTYVDQGNPVEIQLPETAGAYEVRYMTADAKRVLARAPLQIDAVDASVEGPVTAAARSLIQVKWTGPNNERDFVAITQAGKSPTYITYSYTARGNPVTVEVPREPGDYEIHYLTALDYQSLASAKLKVTPATGIGKLQVVAPAAASASSSSTYATVEVVLDASGSMLQKLDGKRRIDIAKNTLNQLLGILKTGEQQFALRVFGHRKADACDTELLLPPAPANSANIAATIN